jgi:protein-disulfide isomerase/uncharacterized membrane protein
MPGRLGYRACIALVALGLAISTYLLDHSLQLGQEETKSGSDVCSTLFGAGCDNTLRSPLAHQLGIPLSGWGVVYFGFLSVLLLLGSWLPADFGHAALLSALVAALVTLPMSVLLVASMFGGYAALCPLCLFVHVINAWLPLALVWAWGPNRRQIFTALGAALRFLVGKEAEGEQRPKWQAIGLFCVLLAALAIYQGVMLQEAPHKPDGVQKLLQALLDFQRAEPAEIPVAADAPRLGPAGAPVQMIVFSDFRCPSCRRFAPRLRELQKEFGSQLAIVFKHFPLDKECNPLVKRDLHPGACRAALVAESARVQGRFWDMHDRLFQTQGKLPAAERDSDNPATRARIAADIRDGAALKIEATPAVFLNGRRVADLRLETLRGLISVAAANAP